MSDEIDDIVIVGAGLAGAKAAEAARDAGFDGSVTIVGDEPHPPYERPPLSKGLLLGEAEPTDTHVHAAEVYDDLDITLHLDDPVTTIERQHRVVVTAAGHRIRYDRLLLATGASPRTLPMGDEGMEDVLTLRTLDDARRLQEHLAAVGHATVVGAGWIGCEVAAAARTLGVDVTLVDPLEVPLQRVLGKRVGGMFADLHAQHDVDLRLGTGVADVTGSTRVEQVVLSDGTSLDTELVVVGIGVVPRDGLAVAAGLDVDDGIVVDETLTTSDPRILAAGDVARAWHPRLKARLRVEHWANALHQGLVAGRNLTGQATPYTRSPYFFSDQYDLGMEYVGHATAPDSVVVRPGTTAHDFIAFWLSDARHVTAAMHANTWGVVDALRAIVDADRQVNPAALADPDVPLGRLAG